MLALLVEDNPGDARLLRELLSEVKGFTHALLHVDRLSRAVEVLHERRVDVVLLDLTLPDAIGLAGLRAIHAAYPRVPIVVLTGLSDEALAIEAMKIGAQDYLVKGEADARLLARSIRYAIERSDSQEAARELVRAQTAHEETALSEQRFRLLAEAIPQIVWAISADGSEAYLSPRWDEYTGQTGTDVLANKWRDAIHPDDYERCLATWAEAGEARALWQVEYRLRRRDGEYRWHLGRSLPHCNRDGEILRWYGTATDIDEQRRAIRTRDDLLATVSHDLRGSLSAISLAAEMLQQAHRDERAVGAIQRAASQMERLIQDLLDMASIESGHLSVTPAVRGVRELAEEALESIQPVASAKSIALEMDVTAAPLPIHCDRGRVLQVFANILGNAVKFTPARGQISIRAHAPDAQFVRFAITDTGPGIEAGQLPYVFDRFWQAKETARAGTGLGLAICKGIIQQHGGAIWVESQLGIGTTFFFTLPIAAPAST